MAANGWAAAARAVSEAHHLVPPITRGQVYSWARRGTINGNGDPFPDGPPFDLAAVVAWYGAGVTGPGGATWETPEQRNERYAHPEPVEAARKRNARVVAHLARLRP